MSEQYIDLSELATRLTVSTRTVRSYVSDVTDPLPAFRIKNKLLFAWPDVVVWLQKYRVQPFEEDEAVDAILKKVNRHDQARQ